MDTQSDPQDHGRRQDGPGRDFGFAVRELKDGRRVTRGGWNGKEMYLARQDGYPDGIPINKNTADATGIPEGTVCKFQPYITLKTAQNTFVPWQPSQTDVLANDWHSVS